MFKRNQFKTLLGRVSEKRKFIQVLVGPRQTGKTTIARQLCETPGLKCHYASADEPALKSNSWIEQQWQAARLLSSGKQRTVLILDEIQKIPGWSETVKRLWDEDTRRRGGRRSGMQVVLLGSSALLIQKGLNETLAGRFEVIPVTHWGYREMRSAFRFSLDEYIFYGGYPGAAELIGDEKRWSDYIKYSLIETTISRDILLMTRVDKPALLRQLFEIACVYSGRILSYQKMLGQLQDAGNTTTLAHYLELLKSAGFVCGLNKYAGQRHRQRSSSPKLQVFNNALLGALWQTTFKTARNQPEVWGRFVESAAGAHLLNETEGKNIEVYYWRDGNKEVDFVLTDGKGSIVAIEVKSGLKKESLPGTDAFAREFKNVKKILVTKGEEKPGGYHDGGIPIEKFLSISPQDLFSL